MKGSEIMEQYYKELTADMVERYRDVLESYGRIEYKIYIWSDGEIEHLLEPQGGNTYLQARDAETRELFYVTTIGGSYFDPWDCADHAAPDDEEERESEEKEIIDWCVDSYRETVCDVLDEIIEDAKREEEYDSMSR